MYHNRSESTQQECQRNRLKHYAAVTDPVGFMDQLASSELAGLLESGKAEPRDRLYPVAETLSMFLAQAMKPDRSCQGIVNDVAVTRQLGKHPRCSTGTGGYCRARKRLSGNGIRGLVRQTGRRISRDAADAWNWLGRPVRLVDGTTVTLPDTHANQGAYPQQSNQKLGLGFPICRIAVMLCLSSGVMLDAAAGTYQGKGSGEQALLRKMLNALESGDILLGDAFFGTYFLLAELDRLGVDGLFEQMGVRKRVTDFGCGRALGKKDHLVVLQKPKVRPDWMTEEEFARVPATLTVRELGAGDKILVTTLRCPVKYTKKALKELYKLRWQVELDIRNIKITLGMETLSCKSPEMCEKELQVYFLAYNLIRQVMLHSALLADVLPRTLSFKHAQQIRLAWSRVCGNSGRLETNEDLLALVAERTVGNRPGRIEPRALKRRPKPYPLLTKPRTEAREQILMNGHPKKQR